MSEINVLYFAWLRGKTGTGQERLELPPDVDSVQELTDWLKRRSAGHAAALDNLAVVRVAVNQEYVQPDHPVRAGDEVAFFPPVTGG